MRVSHAGARVLLALAAMLSAGLASRAQTVPALLNYQGMLRAADGVPMNGTQNITFGIYGAAIGGGAAWTETQSVSVSSGAFSVQLGSVTPLSFSLFSSSPTYLQITVGSTVFMPRRMLLTSPYAANSQLFQGYSLGAFVMNGASSYVGIGTSSPGATLSVSNAALDGANGVANFLNPTMGSSNYNFIAVGKAVSNDNSGLFGWANASTPYAYMGVWGASVGGQTLNITEAGNVGVGATSPSAPLTVEAAADPAFVVNHTGPTGNPSMWLQQDGTTKGFLWWNQTGNLLNLGTPTTNPIISMTNNGNVGIGTSAPSSLLQVAGTSTFADVQFSNSSYGIVGAADGSFAAAGLAGQVVYSAFANVSFNMDDNRHTLTTLTLNPGRWLLSFTVRPQIPGTPAIYQYFTAIENTGYGEVDGLTTAGVYNNYPWNLAISPMSLANCPVSVSAQTTFQLMGLVSLESGSGSTTWSGTFIAVRLP
jgi:hypothetical protein